MANPVWDYRISSPSLGENQVASEWLKHGLSALREAKAARADLAAYRAELAGLVARVVALEERVPEPAPGTDEELREQVSELAVTVAGVTGRLAAAGEALSA